MDQSEVRTPGTMSSINHATPTRVGTVTVEASNDHSVLINEVKRLVKIAEDLSERQFVMPAPQVAVTPSVPKPEIKNEIIVQPANVKAPDVLVHVDPARVPDVVVNVTPAPVIFDGVPTLSVDFSPVKSALYYLIASNFILGALAAGLYFIFK